jgi:sulfotransferase
MISEQKKNKKLFFLVAMPRSGNTVFASLINQNPEIACTANSITLELMKDLYLLKTTDVFQNFPDHKSLNNIFDSVFDLYYKDWPQRIIIDRGPVLSTGRPGNFELMKIHYKHPFKCIVLLRDLMDVLASYMKWYNENPDAFPNRHANTDEDKLNVIMNKDGAVVKDLKAIENAFKHQDICHFVKFDDFIKNPKEELQKIYIFLEEPYYPHYFENLKDININGIEYDDRIVGKNMHKLHTGKVEKIYNPYIEKIPQSIRNKYGHIKF